MTNQIPIDDSDGTGDTADNPVSDQVAQRSDTSDETETESATQPSSRQNWLKGRIRQWRESGLISDEQSEAILNFEAVPKAPFRLGIRFSRLIVVLSTLGAILIGSGIISFVAANWQGIPALGKLAMLIGGQTATYWVAYQLQFVRGYPRVGGAIMFAGAAWFGANVFLVAQSYHLGTENPDLLFLWFLGILPLAYIVRSKAITVMAVAIFTVGVSWKAGTWVEDSENFFPVVGTLLLIAAVIYAVGTLHLLRERMKFHAGPYLVSGVLLAIGVTYILTFKEIFNDLGGRELSDYRDVPGASYALAALVTALAAVSLAVSDRLSIQSGKSLVSRFAEPGMVAFVAIIGWLIITVPFGSPGPYVVSTNLLLIALIFGTIVLGIVNKREAFVNVGIVFFVIDLTTRYIELTVDMLDTSLAFIIGGLLLLGVGYGMERARRRLLRQFGMTDVGGQEVNLDS